ncbi:Zinc finger SWIM domain-containing protein 2 [Wickerhamomyces ciferrii]|uniref:Zinc finger SWIM domain-containing protein 2 n=1 Tax=Wickerhamomyces ciferrii (strain ATCC 14091 / BCRC 22168 / CBS 111 / JCM 3599 / NBRC 0793 / NRRL Y-1031 F-60-10) TaxID=1206466 RepID=K0KVK1_WICCF|nr:Zinc finger SWIM domain-containing protein 2 [Wickerhamomyces ciferrii]CCH45962.1 Zinc finger SWIM domain-containing protein 2 [Wickerhamomyces ciferrii]
MHFKFLIPIALATILAFNGAIQAAPVPQNISESIIDENTPTVSNATTISNQTIEETATPVSSLLDDENSHYMNAEKDNNETKKKKKKSKGLHVVSIVFISLLCPVVGIWLYIGFLNISKEYSRKRYQNFLEMTKYIKRDVKGKGQPWSTYLRRVIFNWKTLGILIIGLSLAGLVILIWNIFKYLFIWPIMAIFNFGVVKKFFATLATPFKIDEYPPPHESNNGNNSNETTTAKGSDEVQGNIVKRSQVEQYIFDEGKLFETANSIFSPEFQCCEELTGDALFEKYPDHASKREPCPICLESLHSNDLLLLLPCNHVYHRACLHDFKRSLQTANLNQVIMVRCPTCQLNLVRLYQYYIDHGLDFKEVKFDNRA